MPDENPARQAACFVIDKLRRKGYQALLAGGCVRDMLLDLQSSDYDVATDAKPPQVKQTFRRVLMVGAKFGVAIVLYRGEQVEVATFRSDASYSDGRHPDAVLYSDPRHDALRRDFTINGMFYDPVSKEVIDYVGGKQDLEARIVRTIDDPRRRFEEDYLRMLRGPRFAVRFGFALEKQTAEAIREKAPQIRSISGERIWDELTKMLSRPSADRAVALLDELNLLEQICPPLYQDPSRLQLGLGRLEHLPETADATLRLAALLADLEAREIKRLTRRWGTANYVRNLLVDLAEKKDQWQEAARWPLARFKRLASDEKFSLLLDLWKAQEWLSTGSREETERIASRLESLSPESINPPPLLDGTDLLEMGLSQGPRIGQILEQIRQLQLAEKIETRDQALAEAKARIPQDP
jgi:tRNA nucleotidyltransferase/poly(A) polymerase